MCWDDSIWSASPFLPFESKSGNIGVEAGVVALANEMLSFLVDNLAQEEDINVEEGDNEADEDIIV